MKNDLITPTAWSSLPRAALQFGLGFRTEQPDADYEDDEIKVCVDLFPLPCVKSGYEFQMSEQTHQDEIKHERDQFWP
jgi:hypothetical protein